MTCVWGEREGGREESAKRKRASEREDGRLTVLYRMRQRVLRSHHSQVLSAISILLPPWSRCSFGLRLRNVGRVQEASGLRLCSLGDPGALVSSSKVRRCFGNTSRLSLSSWCAFVERFFGFQRSAEDETQPNPKCRAWKGSISILERANFAS